jgi:hypothetical protein
MKGFSEKQWWDQAANASGQMTVASTQMPDRAAGAF